MKTTIIIIIIITLTITNTMCLSQLQGQYEIKTTGDTKPINNNVKLTLNKTNNIIIQINITLPKTEKILITPASKHINITKTKITHRTNTTQVLIELPLTHYITKELSLHNKVKIAIMTVNNKTIEIELIYRK